MAHQDSPPSTPPSRERLSPRPIRRTSRFCQAFHSQLQGTYALDNGRKYHLGSFMIARFLRTMKPYSGDVLQFLTGHLCPLSLLLNPRIMTNGKAVGYPSRHYLYQGTYVLLSTIDFTTTLMVFGATESYSGHFMSSSWRSVLAYCSSFLECKLMFELQTRSCNRPYYCPRLAPNSYFSPAHCRWWRVRNAILVISRIPLRWSLEFRTFCCRLWGFDQRSQYPF